MDICVNNIKWELFGAETGQLIRLSGHDLSNVGNDEKRERSLNLKNLDLVNVSRSQEKCFKLSILWVFSVGAVQ